MKLHEAARQTQTETEARLRPLQGAVRLIKFFEDERQLIAGNADPGVLHRYDNPVSLHRCVDPNFSFLRGIFSGIVKQVYENLS